jgi:hypothetical protein
MRRYHCPSCGAEITFQSPVSVTCVCAFCRSLIVRRDRDVEAMGKMAELPDDVSPFQIGTTGSFLRERFSVIGRVRMAWEDGGWNEWFLWFDDGRKGWLAEAQGFLAVSFAQELPEDASWVDKALILGQDIGFDAGFYKVADLKQAECVACEGELPSVFKPGQATFVADAIGLDGGFLSVNCDNRWVARELFAGAYAEFNSFGFSRLRELPGWASPCRTIATSA